MRPNFEALFTEIDPIVAVHHSRAEADASLAALGRAGYGRGMLSVMGDTGATADAKGMARALGVERTHWAASGMFWGGLWALFAIAATRALPPTGTALVGLLIAGALALVLHVVVAARLLAPKFALVGESIDANPPSSVGTPDGHPWRFLVVVRGSRSDIALARDILAH
jgi:hypothetical protein